MVESKWHLMSQCVYFAFKTIVLLKFLLQKKHVFIKRNFQMKYFKTFYCVYSYLNMFFFFYKQFWVDIIFWNCTNLQILHFILKNCHNFKSYQNMLTFSVLVSNIISYKFSSNNIYIASHLTVIKCSWNFLKP